MAANRNSGTICPVFRNYADTSGALNLNSRQRPKTCGSASHVPRQGMAFRE